MLGFITRRIKHLKQTRPKLFYAGAHDGVENARMSVADSLQALEPRIMFDAAGVATGAEVAADNVAEQQADEAIEPENLQPPAANDENTDALAEALSGFQPPAGRNELIFVDKSVDDYQTLLAGINDGAELVFLDAESDGLQQIANTLQDRNDIDAIHIISHGDAGQLQLGNTLLTNDSMQNEHADELAIIQSVLSESADILIYGCNFSEGTTGQEAAQTLASQTGADVAASDDVTGHASLGGDWDLETKVGDIEADVIISENAQSQWVHTLDLTVANQGDANAMTNEVASTASGITIDSGGGAPSLNATTDGNPHQGASTFDDLRVNGNQIMGSGFVISTAATSDLDGNTTTGDQLSAGINAPDGQTDAELQAVADDNAPADTNQYSLNDYIALTFDFTPDAGVNKVAVEYAYGTEEEDFYSTTYNDAFGVWVDDNSGGGYATLASENIYDNYQSGTFIDPGNNADIDPNVEINQMTPVRSGVIDVDDASSNSVKFAIADTRDSQFDSAAFISYFGSSLRLIGDADNSSSAGNGDFATQYSNVSDTPVSVVDNDISITNYDTSTYVEYAELTLGTGAQPGDTLMYSGASSFSLTETPASSGVFRLTWTGTAGTQTTADFEQALQDIRFSTTDDGSTVDREITIKLHDTDGGTATETDSNTITTTVSITSLSIPTVNSVSFGVGEAIVLNGSYDASLGDKGAGLSSSELQVTIDGTTYDQSDAVMAATGGTWTITLPAGSLPVGTYDVDVTTDDGSDVTVDQSLNELEITFDAVDDSATTDQNTPVTFGVLANDYATNPTDTISPTVDWEFNAADDNDGDAIWEADENSGDLGNWVLSASATPVDVTLGTDTEYVDITKAYEFGTGGVTATIGQGITNFNAANNSDTNDATFEVWVKLDDLTQNQVIFETGGTGGGLSIVLADNDTDGTFDDLVLTAVDDADGDVLTATADLSTIIGTDTEITSEYIQIVGTYGNNTIADLFELYVNGELADQASTTTGFNDFDDNTGMGLGTVNGTLAGGGTFNNLEGSIATFRFYENQTLTADQVYDNYLDTTTGGLSIAEIEGTPVSIGDTVDLAGGGTVTINNDGTLTFDPDGDFDYLDDGATDNVTFNYVAQDSLSNTSNEATVTVTVSGTNDAPVNTVPGLQSVDEEIATPIAGISVTDIDNNLASTQLAVINGVLNVTLTGSATISAGSNGSSDLTISGSETDINATLASLTYQGNIDFNGSDTLTVISTDSDGTPLTDTDTVAITVNAVDDGGVTPTTVGITTNEDTDFTGSLPTNDPDGLPATGAFAETTAPSNGTLTLDADTGAYTYTPDADFNGSDNFVVTVTDAEGFTSTIGVDVTVNPVPEIDAQPDTGTTTDDAVLSVDGPGVLANDSDLSPPAGAITEITTNLRINLNAAAETSADEVWNNTISGQSLGGASDSFNYDNNDVSYVTPTTSLPGITRAYAFDGNGSTAEYDAQADGGKEGFGDTNADIDESTDATFEIWFKPAITTDNMVIFETGNKDGGVSITLNGTILNYYVENQGTGVSSLIQADLSTIIPGGDITQEFIQVVAVYDRDASGTSDHMTLFVNGRNVGDNFTSTTAPTGLNDWANDKNAALGGEEDGLAIDDGANEFQGEIAIFRFYEGSAFDKTQVQTNFQAVAGPQLYVTAVTDPVTATSGTVDRPFTLDSGAVVTLNTDGSYDYDPNGAFDYLITGQSATDTFEYTVSDLDGNSETASVTITINGTGAGFNAVDDSNTTDEDTLLSVGASDPDNLLNNDTIIANTITPGITLGYDAANDTDGNAVWEDDTGFSTDPKDDWTLGSGVTRTSTLTNYPGITEAYSFAPGNAGATADQWDSGAATDDGRVDASFEYWVRVDASATTGLYMIYETGDNDGGFAVVYDADNNDIIWRYEDKDSNESTTLTADLDALGVDIKNEFIQIALTMGAGDEEGTSGDPNTLRLYINGEQAAVDNSIDLDRWSDKKENGLGTTADESVYDDIGPVNNFVGEIARLSFYDDNILTAADVRSNFSAIAQHYFVSGASSFSGSDSDIMAEPAAGAGPNSVSITTDKGASVTVNSDGSYSYDPGSVFQSLDVGESDTDQFIYTVTDVFGDTFSAVVTITIEGAEDAPVITGTFSGAVSEDGTLIDSGTLSISDIDTSDNPVSFADVPGAAGDNGYGTFSLSSGNWTYTLDNSNPAVQALNNGETLTDTYTFTATDGSTQQVTVTINGRDDIDFAISSDVASINEDAGESVTYSINVGGQISAGNTANININAGGSATSGTDYTNFISAVSSAASATPGVTFDGVDTLTFDENFVGPDFSFTLTAINDVYSESENISVTLSSASSPFGEATISTPSALVDIIDGSDTTSVSLTGPATIAEGDNVTITATVDTAPQGGTLVLTLNNGQTITIADGATTGTVSFVAQSEDAFVDAGNETYSITGVTNNGDAYEDLVTTDTVTVAVTDTVDTTSVSLTGPATIAEGDNVTITATVDTAPQGGTLVLTLNNGQTITIADGATTGTVSFVAQSEDAFVDAGNETYSITGVTNNGDAYEDLVTTDTVTVAVTDTVDTTSVSLTGPATIAEGDNVTITATVDTAPQGGTLVLTLNNGQTITIADGATTGTVSFVAQSEDAFVDAGNETYSITGVTNNGDAYEDLVTTDTVTVAVTDTVDTTSVSLTGPATIAEGDNVTITATVDTAPQGGTLVLTLNNGQTITIADGATTGTVSFVAQSEDAFVDAGNETYSITGVTNNGDAYEDLVTTDTVTVAVTDTVDTTSVSLTGPATIAEGDNVTITATVDTAPQGGTLVLTLNNGQTITIADGATTGTVSFVAQSEDAFVDAGNETYSITGVTNNGDAYEDLVTTDTVTVAVTDTVDTTSVSLTGPATIAEGDNVTITATVDTAPQGGTLVLTLNNGQTITIADGATTGTVSFVAQSEDAFVDAGNETYSITGVTNNGDAYEDLVTTDTVTVAVTDTVDTTSVSLTGPATIAEGDNVTITATVDTAPQGGTLVLTLNNGQTITIADGATTGTVSFVAQSEDAFVDAGNETYSITGVTNNGDAYEDLVTTDTVTVAVTDTVDEVKISLAGPGNVTEGDTTGNYTVSLTDAGGNPVNTLNPVTVSLTYSGTAIDGSDFNGVASVTIPGGSSSSIFNINTIADVVAEGTEDFTVTLNNITAGATDFENLVIDAANDALTTSISEGADVTPPAAPVIDTPIAVDNIINAAEDDAVVISGTAEANSTIDLTVTDGTNTITRTVTTNGAGVWTLAGNEINLNGFDQGGITVTATATDAAGNTSGVTTATPIYDSIAPSAPGLNTISLDSGTPGDLITNDNTLLFTGNTEANATVEVFVDGVSVGTTTANGAGNWTFDYSGTTLADGTYAVTTQATDTAGNTGALSADTNVTIDTTAPAPTITINQVAGDDILNAAEAGGNVDVVGVVTGEFITGDTVTVTVNGNTYTDTVDAGGNFTVSVPGSDVQNDPSVDVGISTTDAAGNVGGDTTTSTVTVDVTAPAPTITINTIAGDDILNAAEAGANVDVVGVVTGEFTVGDTVTVTVNGNTYTNTVDAGGNFTISVPGSDLQNDPTVDVSISTTDAAGNVGGDTTTATVTVDVTAPAPTITIGAIAGDNILSAAEIGGPVDVSGTVGGSGYSAGDVVTVQVNGNTYTGTIDAGGNFTISVPGSDVQADPSVEASITLTDTAGNTGIANQILTVTRANPPASESTVFEDIDPVIEGNNPMTSAGSRASVGTANTLSAEGAVLDAVEAANRSSQGFGDNIDDNLADNVGIWEFEGVRGFSVSFSLTELGRNSDSLSSLFPLREGLENVNAEDQLIVKSILRDRMIFLEIDYSIESDPNLFASNIRVTMLDGSPLPEWLRADDNGALLSGEPPVGQETLQLRIQITLSDETVIVRYVDVNVDSGEIASLQHISEQYVVGSGLFEDKLKLEASKFDSAADVVAKSFFN